MEKFKKRMCVTIVTVFLIMCVTFPCYAAVSAWGSFNFSLPANSADYETGLIGRVNTTTTKKYFTVTVSTLGTSAVRVWTETRYGYNLSGPYKNSIATGTYNCSYDIVVPNQGDNVRLNFDNPVNTSMTPRITGSWTPN